MSSVVPAFLRGLNGRRGEVEIEERSGEWAMRLGRIRGGGSKRGWDGNHWVGEGIEGLVECDGFGDGGV
jgi:hypothetical protein